ncbi:hypothetical protein ACQZV8_19095, partial [Magnetococcales bacterium HHB-1]
IIHRGERADLHGYLIAGGSIGETEITWSGHGSHIDVKSEKDLSVNGAIMATGDVTLTGGKTLDLSKRAGVMAAGLGLSGKGSTVTLNAEGGGISVQGMVTSGATLKHTFDNQGQLTGQETAWSGNPSHVVMHAKGDIVLGEQIQSNLVGERFHSMTADLTQDAFYNPDATSDQKIREYFVEGADYFNSQESKKRIGGDAIIIDWSSYHTDAPEEGATFDQLNSKQRQAVIQSLGYTPLHDLEFSQLKEHTLINGVMYQKDWSPTWKSSNQKSITQLKTTGVDHLYLRLPDDMDAKIERIFNLAGAATDQEKVGTWRDQATVLYTQERNILDGITTNGTERWQVSDQGDGKRLFDLNGATSTISFDRDPSWSSVEVLEENVDDALGRNIIAPEGYTEATGTLTNEVNKETIYVADNPQGEWVESGYDQFDEISKTRKIKFGKTYDRRFWKIENGVEYWEKQFRNGFAKMFLNRIVYTKTHIDTSHWKATPVYHNNYTYTWQTDKTDINDQRQTQSQRWVDEKSDIEGSALDKEEKQLLIRADASVSIDARGMITLDKSGKIFVDDGDTVGKSDISLTASNDVKIQGHLLSIDKVKLHSKRNIDLGGKVRAGHLIEVKAQGAVTGENGDYKTILGSSIELSGGNIALKDWHATTGGEFFITSNNKVNHSGLLKGESLTISTHGDVTVKTAVEKLSVTVHGDGDLQITDTTGILSLDEIIRTGSSILVKTNIIPGDGSTFQLPYADMLSEISIGEEFYDPSQNQLNDSLTNTTDHRTPLHRHDHLGQRHQQQSQPLLSDMIQDYQLGDHPMDTLQQDRHGPVQNDQQLPDSNNPQNLEPLEIKDPTPQDSLETSLETKPQESEIPQEQQEQRQDQQNDIPNQVTQERSDEDKKPQNDLKTKRTKAVKTIKQALSNLSQGSQVSVKELYEIYKQSVSDGEEMLSEEEFAALIEQMNQDGELMHSN